MLSLKFCGGGEGRGEGQESFLSLPASSVTGKPWHSLAYGCIIPVSATIFTWSSSPCVCVFIFCYPLCMYVFPIKTLVIGFWPSLLQYELILTHLGLQRPYFQTKSYSQVLEIRRYNSTHKTPNQPEEKYRYRNNTYTF